MNLLGGKIACYALHIPHNFINERLGFSRLKGNKVPPALLGNLYKGIACHVLDTYRLVRNALPTKASKKKKASKPS